MTDRRQRAVTKSWIITKPTSLRLYEKTVEKIKDFLGRHVGLPAEQLPDAEIRNGAGKKLIR